MKKRLKTEFNRYQIVFTTNCNLRCKYCSTGYGRLGGKVETMNQETINKLIVFILENTPGETELQFEFGCGETFTAYSRFIEFVKYANQECSKKDIEPSFSVTTNGTLLNSDQMMELAKLKIFLVFSIDGPEKIHDLYRINAQKKGTHQNAFDNFKQYRNICQELRVVPGCQIQSVYTKHSNLEKLAFYWAENGEFLSPYTIQNDSKYIDNDEIGTNEEIQKQYLKQLRVYSKKQALALSIPDFLNQYRGTEDIYGIWTKMFLEGPEKELCSAGSTVASVNVNGDLYPCELFIGNPIYKIGSVFDGIDDKKLKVYLDQKNRIVKLCESCKIRKICPKGCLATDNEMSMEENFKDGCRFFEKVCEIATETYSILSKKNQ